MAAEFLRFVRLCGQRLAQRPWLTLQSAANLPDALAPAQQARSLLPLESSGGGEASAEEEEEEEEADKGRGVGWWRRRHTAAKADGGRRGKRRRGPWLEWRNKPQALSALQLAMEHGGGPVYSVCHSDDGLWMASGGEDGRVLVWEVATGAVQAELEHGLSLIHI